MKYLPKIKPDSVFIGVIGFFLGRVIMFQFVSPFAVAFVAGYMGFGMKFYIPALLTMAGVLSSLHMMYALKPMAAFAVLALINFAFKNGLRMPLQKAAAAAAATLSSGLALSALRGGSLYFAVAAVVETVFVFGATVVLFKSVRILSAFRRSQVLGAEEQISLAILSAAVIVGAMDIYLGVLPLGWVFLMAGLMFIAQKLGGSASAATALVLGIALAASGLFDYTLPAVLGTAAITSGFFRGKSKWATAGGFAAGLTVAMLYISGPPSVGIFAALACATVVFMFIPDNLYFTVNTLASQNVCNAEDYLDRVKTILGQQLYGFSSSFEKLSRTFSALAKPKSGVLKNDAGEIIDNIAEKVCSNCGMNVFCWQENFYDTYGIVFNLISNCEAKNRLDIRDLPKEFRCANAARFTETANRIFELHKINAAWRNRVAESRDLISEQLGSVSKLIQSLAADLDVSMSFKIDLEAAVYEELSAFGIEVERVIVLENKAGKYEVSMRPKACPGRSSCVKELSRIVGRVLGRRLCVEERQCTYNGACSLRLVEEQKYRISSGVACMSKAGSPVSGDNYSFMELKNGQCLMALSDGMGSGSKAREESAAAVELLEDFIETGFEKDMAVRMINSVLVLKSDMDSFSTLDICTIDLHTGQAEFIKIGAAATYLLRDGDVQVVKSSSLPIGMLNTVDLEVSSKVLRDNDVIVMVTDGLTEADGDSIDKSAWLLRALSGVKGRNPQDIADFLISSAAKLCADGARDDMTVLAARVWCKA